MLLWGSFSLQVMSSPLLEVSKPTCPRKLPGMHHFKHPELSMAQEGLTTASWMDEFLSGCDPSSPTDLRWAIAGQDGEGLV